MKKFVSAFAFVLAFSTFANAAPEVCQLKLNGTVYPAATFQDENGQGFFAAANQYAVQNRVCVHAKIDQVPSSGRVYSQSGALVPSYSGQKKGLSNAEAQEAKSQAGGSCVTYSCVPLVYNERPQYEQPVQQPIDISTGENE